MQKELFIADRLYLEGVHASRALKESPKYDPGEKDVFVVYRAHNFIYANVVIRKGGIAMMGGL